MYPDFLMSEKNSNCIDFIDWVIYGDFHPELFFAIQVLVIEDNQTLKIFGHETLLLLLFILVEFYRL